MVEAACLLHLSFAELDKLLGEVWFVFLKDLKCDFASIGIETFFDLGTET
jgi:hypothetical protein